MAVSREMSNALVVCARAPVAIIQAPEIGRCVAMPCCSPEQACLRVAASQHASKPTGWVLTVYVLESLASGDAAGKLVAHLLITEAPAVDASIGS